MWGAGCSRVTHPFATLLTPEGAFSFDLHVLSTPPAFILSQDQTLRSKLTKLKSLDSKRCLSRKFPDATFKNSQLKSRLKLDSFLWQVNDLCFNSKNTNWLVSLIRTVSGFQGSYALPLKLSALAAQGGILRLVLNCVKKFSGKILKYFWTVISCVMPCDCSSTILNQIIET